MKLVVSYREYYCILLRRLQDLYEGCLESVKCLLPLMKFVIPIMMKKLFLVLLTIISISLTSKAQSLDDFCMPHIRTAEEAAKYVGKQVVVYQRSTRDPKYKDTQKFDTRFYGITDRTMTIKKIKFGSQIVFHLDYDGYKIKVPVNMNGAVNYDGLSSCNIFFLVDEFNKYRNEQIGRRFLNAANETVAVLEDIEIATRVDEPPVFLMTIKSPLTNKKCVCQPEEAESLTKVVGTTISHPQVKAEYKVLGLSNLSNTDVRFKYIYSLCYDYENLLTGEKDDCLVESLYSAPFEKALTGKYVSLLSNVEKPANPEIRYGETTVIPSEDAVSKFSYKDNVIDILIFGVRDGFDFVLQNISGSTIKIIWDEAVFVNFDGSTEKVMHKGTKYAERNESQPPTTIIKNAKWEDSVTPTNLVYYYESTNKYLKSGWQTHSLYPREKGLDPGQVMLMLPIQIKDVVNEYIFVFDVKYVFEHPELLK